MPLSSTLNTKTAPDLIMVLCSDLLRRRVMRGMTPCRAAWMRRRASTVISTKPVKGGTSGLLVIDGKSLLVISGKSLLVSGGKS